MIESPTRPDWFVVSPEDARDLAYVPGLWHDDRAGHWLIPRNMLPLLAPGRAILASPRTPQRPGANVFTDGTVLRPHQVTGVAFLSDRRGSLLADGLRTGKTATCVATHDPAMGPLVVVGPLATRRVWIQWMRRRWPDAVIATPEGRTFDGVLIDHADLIFLHYEIVQHWVSIGVNRRIGTLVFDEGHVLSNKKSSRAQTAHTMAPMAERMIVATGTPLWNKPSGLWSVLNIVAPASFGTFREFSARYCGGQPGAHGWVADTDITNLDEFRDRTGEIMIRRVWAELVDDLPETARTQHIADLTRAQERKLDKIVLQVESLAGTRGNARTLIGLMSRYRRQLGGIKAAAAIPVILDRIANGPVVVWSWHKEVARTIRDVVADKAATWMITGEVNEALREGILDEWRSCSHGVLIMSLPIGQAGIDLAHSRQAIFVELDWTPVVMGQAEMRTFAPTRGDEIVYIIANHDIDQRLAAVIAEKCERAKLLGMPAADSGLDTITRVFDKNAPVPDEADLAGLAARIIDHVREHGTTFL